MRLRSCAPGLTATAAVALLVTACSPGVTMSPASSASGLIVAVGAENQYANVISQIGGKYVQVSAIESNPNTDPHTFEASTSVAESIATAQLVVQNGLGYDTFMNRMESGSPSSARKVIEVQGLLGLPDSTPNPHLWYSPDTMPVVARAIASDLAAIRPAHRAYFEAMLRSFDRSLQPWLHAIAALRAGYAGAPVATTEPVGNYLLQAAGLRNLTPFELQADVMNGVDPAPQDVALQDSLLCQHKVGVLVYNQQVVDSLTGSFLAMAKHCGTPVVGVYETMPAPGYDYQSWMLAETQALRKALASHISTQRL